MLRFTCTEDLVKKKDEGHVFVATQVSNTNKRGKHIKISSPVNFKPMSGIDPEPPPSKARSVRFQSAMGDMLLMSLMNIRREKGSFK